ncbi:restriction endonuclease subunit S [Micromonospora sp. KC723]|uniref:restriction endonuclease subunit S n=1 Tax=Micromonospora sp. KC723 TaxID=2530381 RepID=UPI00104EE221|nr:restriction endonuclease subunit S [Micromonospora sp. KC723]TDB78487.1 restriction endonuclease subunit S [Micromonospora sp. KC723]
MISREVVEGRFTLQPLGEVVEFLDHLRRPVTASDRVAGPYPYYGANGQQGTMADYIFDEPLVLLAEDGGHFDAPNRGIAYRISGKTWVNNHAHVLRPRHGIDLAFLCRALENYDVRPYITGTTRGKLTKAGASRIPIPVPPLEQQRRIAEVLDQADELRAKRRDALARLDDLPRSIFLDMFGDPIQNKHGWSRVSMSSLLERIHSGHSPQCLDRPAGEGEWGVLKLGAVTSCEFMPDENKALPPGVAPRQEHAVRVGDLLFSRKNTRELVGACALVRVTPPKLLLPDLVFRLELYPDAAIDKVFLQQLLVYPSKRRQIQSLAGGSAGSMPNISKARLMATEVEVPPLSLQRDFTRRIDAIEELRAVQRAGLAVLDTLFASLQDRAFRGLL